MAIFFPSESPIKWFEYDDRLTKAAKYEECPVHLYDDGMFQFWDATYGTHRVVVFDDTFTQLGELASGEFDFVTVGSKNVGTIDIAWNDYFAEKELGYLGIIDANDNYYYANFLPNGDFATTSLWTLDAGLSIAGGSLSYSGTDSTADATYDNPLTASKQYTVTVNIENVAFVGVGVLTVQVFHNGTNQGEISFGESPGDSGTLTATFTTVATDLVIRVVASGTASCDITSVQTTVLATQSVVKWVSAPFCVQNLDGDFLIHGCAVNDYFNTFYSTTGYIPRLRVPAEFRDVPPEQSVEQYISTGGVAVNYFVESVFQQELRVDWIPAYLVNFLATVFYLDFGAIDNVPYRPIEEPSATTEEEASDIVQMTIRLVKQNNAAGFKQIINDPSTANCEVTTGAYVSQNDGTQYTQQGTGEIYYPQQ